MVVNNSNAIEIKNIEKNIVKAYVEVLGRMPDPKGLSDYLDLVLANNLSVGDIRSSLMSSKEYKKQLSLIRDGKISHNLAHISEGGQIVWHKTINNEELEDAVSKKWDMDKIVFVSTWNKKCGIASYTKYLTDTINRSERLGIGMDKIVGVFSVNNGIGYDKINGKIVHIEHEFGIFPKMIRSDSKVVVTFHTIPEDIGKTMSYIENRLDVVAYIAHFDKAYELMKEGTKKDVYIIPHGSKVIAGGDDSNMKLYARQLLNVNMKNENGINIKENEDFAFVFGFQSGNKNFNEIIDACRNVGIKLVISGGLHECGFSNQIGKTLDEGKNSHVIFLDKYLNDLEIDLWSLASDVLLFNYIGQPHYSCSGAMHRIIGSGRPIVCSNTKHFTDVEESDGVLKFDNDKDSVNSLEDKIREALNRRDELGMSARMFAMRSSWEKVADAHMNIYNRYVDL